MNKLINYLIKKKYYNDWYIFLAYLLLCILGQRKRYSVVQGIDISNRMTYYYFEDNDYEFNTTSKR